MDMVKLLLFLALVANLLFIVSATGTSRKSRTRDCSPSNAQYSSRSQSSSNSGSQSGCQSGSQSSSEYGSQSGSQSYSQSSSQSSSNSGLRYESQSRSQACSQSSSESGSQSGSQSNSQSSSQSSSQTKSKSCPTSGTSSSSSSSSSNATSGGKNKGGHCNTPPRYKNQHEMYDACPDLCSIRSCDTDPNVAILCVEPPKPGSPDCQPQCVCEKGYVRNDKQICVTPEECPKPTSCGGDPNAESGCGVNCIRCSNYNNTEPRACPEFCRVGGCDCKPGYIFDDISNKCVLPKDCTPVCGNNEIISNCTNGGCFGARTCDEMGKEVICLNLEASSCIKGCICQKGYLRDSNGTCIKQDQCPIPKCKQHEVFNFCPNLCPPKRCDFDESLAGLCIAPPEPGSPDCKPQCVCEDGYVRNDQEICVTRDECPKPTSCGGDSNAEKGCGVNCIRCSNYKNKEAIACPDFCRLDGCDCKPDYIFDDISNKCVLPKDCTPVCGNNEIISNCTNGGCFGARTCDEMGKLVACRNLEAGSCIKGCICQKGYLRDSNGTCIKQDQCPIPKCKQHEVFDFCPRLCPPRRCDFDGRLAVLCIAPPEAGSPDCEPQCVCEDGYVRNDQEICVTRDQCPCNGDQNAVPGCGMNYGRHCSDYKQKDNTTDPPNVCRLDGCDCKPDYVLDENIGKCVLPQDCTPVCGNNEVYSNCTNGGCFGARTCDEIGKEVVCRNLVAGSCKKGCVCRKDYLRARNGTCVKQEECPTPNPQCNQQYEVYDKCSTTCPPQTCDSIGKRYSCPLQLVNRTCIGACRCKTGYYRNYNQDCISEENCLKCTGPNEFFSCGGACDNVCATLNEQNQTNCPIINIKCNEMCYCEPGYARDSNNTCILIENCPKQCPGPNEYRDPCPPKCQPQTCDSIGKKIPCPIQPAVCMPACRCNKGYFRNNDGVCILEKDCHPQCNQQYEVYDNCSTTCPPQTCESIGKIYPCPLQPVNRTCIGACRCKTGYYRNYNQDCISEENCLKCTGPNEFFSCGGACDNVCATLNKQNQTNCPIINIKCNDMCYCEPGYARDSNNICIPIENCPKRTQCNKPHEVYVSCPVTCPPQTCESINQTYHCPIQRVNRTCAGACRCETGYYRNKKGECISKENCLKCTGPHEYWSCGVACDNVCATLRQQNQKNCPIINKKCNEMCYCESDYARADNNTCIPIKNCPPTCPDGEVYNTCPAEQCDAEYCPRTRNDPLYCKSTKNCQKPRCTCGFNRHRDRKTGKCIATSSCPPFKCDGPNEKYDSCPPVCPGQNCSDYINKSTCPKFGIIGIVVPCTPECRCKDNYYRNSRGLCVTGSQCEKEQNTCHTTDATPPPHCGGPGETVIAAAPLTGNDDFSTV